MKRTFDEFVHEVDENIAKKQKMCDGDGPIASFLSSGAVSSNAVNHIYFNGDVNNTNIINLIKNIQQRNDEFDKNQTKTLEELTKNTKYTKIGDKFMTSDTKFLIDIKPAPIYLHITSFGGSVLSCMPLLDAMERSKIPIYTVVEGYAASAATMISLYGVKRYITKNSYMLIHQLSAGAIGSYAKLQDNFENCTAFMTRIKNITLNEIEDQLRHDHWFDAEKCISVGLADEYY
jgi:ATP-dependent protease ClpP protease subunit